MTPNIFKNAVVNAVLTAAYIVLIATFLSQAKQIFGPEEPKTVLVPIVMLSLLVFSVAVVGTLIFGRPVLWYLNGQKREAVKLLAHTLGIFLLLTILALITLYLNLAA